MENHLCGSFFRCLETAFSESKVIKIHVHITFVNFKMMSVGLACSTEVYSCHKVSSIIAREDVLDDQSPIGVGIKVWIMNICLCLKYYFSQKMLVPMWIAVLSRAIKPTNPSPIFELNQWNV